MRRLTSLSTHVERAIEGIKNYSITKFITISLAPIADELVFVAFFLHFFNNHHHGHDISYTMTPELEVLNISVFTDQLMYTRVAVFGRWLGPLVLRPVDARL